MCIWIVKEKKLWCGPTGLRVVDDSLMTSIWLMLHSVTAGLRDWRRIACKDGTTRSRKSDEALWLERDRAGMVRMDVGSRHGKLSVSDGEACGFSILGISGSHEVK